MSERFGKLPWLWLSLVIFVVDQASKFWFDNNLTMYQQIVIIPDYFSWTLLYNTGAAFSFLADAAGWQRWFFAAVAVGVSVVLVVWLKRLKPEETWLALALAMVGRRVGQSGRPRGVWPCSGLHPAALAPAVVFPSLQRGRYGDYRRSYSARAGYVQK